MRSLVRVFGVAVLALFAGFVAFVLFCAAILPQLRVPARDDVERLRASGFQLTTIRYQAPIFQNGGAELGYERVEVYTHRDRNERREVVQQVSVPTGSSPASRDSRDFARTEVAVGRLLVLGGLRSEIGFVAIDPSCREIAFSAVDGILWRRSSGKWTCPSGGALPASLRRLNESAWGANTLEERLAHPDSVVWMDAAVESILRHGVRASVFADALLRVYRERLPIRDRLIRLLLDAGDDPEVARAILGTSEDDLLQRALIADLTRREGESDIRARARVLLLLARSEWAGRSIGVCLRDFLVRSLEDGSFSFLSESDRNVVFSRMTQFVDASFRDRLEAVLVGASGVSCVAAYLLLRELAGRPLAMNPEASMEREAKRWWSLHGRAIRRILEDRANR